MRNVLFTLPDIAEYRCVNWVLTVITLCYMCVKLPVREKMHKTLTFWEVSIGIYLVSELWVKYCTWKLIFKQSFAKPQVYKTHFQENFKEKKKKVANTLFMLYFIYFSTGIISKFLIFWYSHSPPASSASRVISWKLFLYLCFYKYLHNIEGILHGSCGCVSFNTAWVIYKSLWVSVVFCGK